MTSERYLVTGALGCIGAWAVKRLVDEGQPVWTYDLAGEPSRLRLIMPDEALDKVHFVTGDITDFAAFERVVTDNGITRIIHLAALQVPFVRANPILGAQVNVVGTTVVLEAAKRHSDHVRNVVYASSAAVYGAPDDYPPGPMAADALPQPLNLYGVFKQANEGTARIYWQDYRVHSIGLRPAVVYGPGRDQGMTSTPTKAMAAAAAGRAYHISYGGSAAFQYADDTAGVFIQAVRSTVEGAPVFNLSGTTATIEEVVALIEANAPAAAGRITFERTPLSVPPAYDSRPLEAAIGAVHWTPMADGVRQTIETFRSAWQAGRLDIARAMQ